MDSVLVGNDRPCDNLLWVLGIIRILIQPDLKLTGTGVRVVKVLIAHDPTRLSDVSRDPVQDRLRFTEAH